MRKKTFTISHLAGLDRPPEYMADMRAAAITTTASTLTFDLDADAYKALKIKYRPPASTPPIAEPPAAAPPASKKSVAAMAKAVPTGPVAWHMIHSRVRRAIVDKPAFINWLIPLAGTCGACVVKWHARIELLRKNLQQLDTIEGAIAWALAEHNLVRESQGKDPWPPTPGPLDPRPIVYCTTTGSTYTLHNTQSGAVILAGNGPSLASGIPADLTGLPVMAINNAAAVVKATYWVGADPPAKFSAAIFTDPSITKFYTNGYQDYAIGNGKVRDCPNVVYTSLDDGFDPATWLAKSVIAFGNDAYSRSSMAAGLRVLIDLGYRTIYLVGVDWQMDEAKPYASAHEKGAVGVKQNNQLYTKWGERFAALADELAVHGVTIINRTPDSKLTAFPTTLPPAWTVKEPKPGPVIVVGANQEQEDLLPWWFANLRRFHPDVPVMVADFGMSDQAKAWCVDRARVVAGPQTKGRKAWFAKADAILQADHETVLWLDNDTEIVGDLSPLWTSLLPASGIAVAPDPAGTRPGIGNSGVCVVRHGDAQAIQWAAACKTTAERSDQEALYDIGVRPSLPARFNSLRLAPVDDPVVKHWTGPAGKEYIRSLSAYAASIAAAPMRHTF